jgi:hypothetical protein
MKARLLNSSVEMAGLVHSRKIVQSSKKLLVKHDKQQQLLSRDKPLATVHIYNVALTNGCKRHTHIAG